MIVTGLILIDVGVCSLQCSCLPVKTDPSGGSDIIVNFEKLESPARAGRGLSCWMLSIPSEVFTGASLLVVVRSTEPLS